HTIVAANAARTAAYPMKTRRATVQRGGRRTRRAALSIGETGRGGHPNAEASRHPDEDVFGGLAALPEAPKALRAAGHELSAARGAVLVDAVLRDAMALFGHRARQHAASAAALRHARVALE